MSTSPTQRTIRELKNQGRRCANCHEFFDPIRPDRTCCSKECAQAIRTAAAAKVRRLDNLPPRERLVRSFLRFMTKIAIDEETGCWNWTAARDRHGYGRFGVAAGRVVFAHRTMYLVSVGDIPDNMVIDHLCRNPSCCNTDHLEVVTQAENVRRGNRWPA